MAHSLEVRVPLVDVELFRTVTRLTQAGHAPGKQDMAVSPITPLPADVIHRRKTGFSIPMQSWLSNAIDDPITRTARGLRPWATWLSRRHQHIGPAR
jgi:asparagine synthase (glutamine-hydrolysing)